MFKYHKDNHQKYLQPAALLEVSICVFSRGSTSHQRIQYLTATGVGSQTQTYIFHIVPYIQLLAEHAGMDFIFSDVSDEHCSNVATPSYITCITRLAMYF